MAKALSNIQFGDEDGNVTMYPAGSELPDEVLQQLRGLDYAVDEPLELDELLESASDQDAVIEIAPGISAPNPKFMTEEEMEEYDEDGFKAAVESIRAKPLTATSGEPSWGRIPGTDADHAFMTSTNQRALNVKHREVVEKVIRAEEERVPVGSAVAGQNPQVRASRVAAGPAGFQRRPPDQAPRPSRAQLRAGTNKPAGRNKQQNKAGQPSGQNRGQSQNKEPESDKE